MPRTHAAVAGSFALVVSLALAGGPGAPGAATATGVGAVATVGFLRFAPGSLSDPAGRPASSAVAWREARLRAAELDDAERIATFARRYSIAPRLSREIYDAARAAQLSPELAFGLVQTESGFDPRAVGPRGSIGLTQLQPATARELAPHVSRRELFTPRVNLAIGFRYLRRLLVRFDDDVTLALAAYNGGPGRVERLLASGRRPGRTYARKVLRHVGPGSPATL